MGTNFYAIKRKPSLYNTPLHIGKSSGGWMFLFHGYQDYHFDNEFYYDEAININSIEDWAKYLKNDNIVILNEYDEEYTYEEFFKMVFYKQLIGANNPDNFKNCANIDGFRFTYRDFG